MDATPDTRPRERRIALPSRGGEMAALEFGPATRPIDVVFSHANGFNARTYRSLLAPLAAELRILALDMRGHGASSLPADPETWTGWGGYAQDLLALLEAEAQAPVVLAGHSMGATVSLLATPAAGARVRGLVMFEPVLLSAGAEGVNFSDQPLAQGARRRRDTYPDRAAAEAAYRGRGAFKTWSDVQLADYVAGGFRETDDGQVTLTCRPAWEAHNFSVHNYDAWPALEAGRVPIRVLRAERDSTSVAGAERLAGLAARGRIRCEVVPGTTHFLPMERPDLFAAALREAAVGDTRPGVKSATG